MRHLVTVTIREAGHRLHVTVTSPHLAAQQDARTSFRSAFPRHGQRVWLHGRDAPLGGCWSIPRASWRLLEAWAVGQGYRIVWIDDTDDADGEETA